MDFLFIFSFFCLFDRSLVLTFHSKKCSSSVEFYLYTHTLAANDKCVENTLLKTDIGWSECGDSFIHTYESIIFIRFLHVVFDLFLLARLGSVWLGADTQKSSTNRSSNSIIINSVWAHVSVCVNFRWLWFPLTLLVVIRCPWKRDAHTECVLNSSRVSRWWVCLVCLWFIFFFSTARRFFLCVYFSILSLNHGALSLCDIINVLLSIVFFFVCSIWVPPWNCYCWRIYSFALHVCVCVCFWYACEQNTNRRMSIKIVPCLFYCKNDQRSINIMCPALAYLPIQQQQQKNSFVFFYFSSSFDHQFVHLIPILPLHNV